MNKDNQDPDDPLIPDHPDEEAEIVVEPVDEPSDEETGDEISLPSPNLKDGDGSATYRNETSIARRTEEWGTEYEHPLDSFTPTPKLRRFTFKGCLVIGVGLLLVGLVVFVGVFSWATTGRFVQQGYEVVRLADEESVISEPPNVPTCYIGKTIDVRIPKCSQPIAVIGYDITVRGDFLSKASFMAYRLHTTRQSRFGGDLEIYAGGFLDQSETVLGIQNGITLREILPKTPETTTP